MIWEFESVHELADQTRVTLACEFVTRERRAGTLSGNKKSAGPSDGLGILSSVVFPTTEARAKFQNDSVVKTSPPRQDLAEHELLPSMLRATSIRSALQKSSSPIFQKNRPATHTARVAMGNCLTTCAAAAPKYEIVVKGDPASGLTVLADCPFSHRALLAIEEKKVPYTRTYVDLDNKPQWLLDINPDGTVPVLKDLATGTWTVGSDVVSDLMEKEFPEPSVGTVAGSPDVAGSLLGAFKGFLNAEGGKDSKDSKEKEAKLREVLAELDAFLDGKQYIGGDIVCQTDFLVMPRLYHMKVACKEFRGWEMGAGEYENVKAYMDRFMARDSWKNTAYGEALVVKGWERHGVKRV